MTLANYFYNGLTRKYVSIFGSAFNKMRIEREDSSNVVQTMTVPISYGPYQKFLSKIRGDRNLDRPSAISLPRMSFEILSMNYDGARKLSTTNKIHSGTGIFNYVPVPYNIDFNLYIMTKYAEDGSKILEQILPFFQPSHTFTVNLMENVDPIDIPLILTSISSEDMYEGDYETRRALMWTLSFTMKGYFFGPQRTKSIIKIVDVHNYEGIENPEPDNEVRTEYVGEELPIDGEDWSPLITIQEVIEDE